MEEVEQYPQSAFEECSEQEMRMNNLRNEIGNRQETAYYGGLHGNLGVQPEDFVVGASIGFLKGQQTGRGEALKDILLMTLNHSPPSTFVEKSKEELLKQIEEAFLEPEISLRIIKLSSIKESLLQRVEASKLAEEEAKARDKSL